MNRVDNYLYCLKKTYIIKSDLLGKYKQFDYEDEDDMELDLDLLLSVKYNNIKVSELKEERCEQTKFRKELLKLYSECIVTKNNCDTELDAAHIKPHSEGGKYHINNGLILSTNLHRTFDKYLWSINPDTLIIECNKNRNTGSIKMYENKKINLKLTPKLKENLQYHYDNFIKN
jgi:predicted restriction endonuclease